LSSFVLKVSVLETREQVLAGNEEAKRTHRTPRLADASGQLHGLHGAGGAMIDRFTAAWDDPSRRAKILRSLWWISTGFLLFGFAVIFYRVLFPR